MREHDEMFTDVPVPQYTFPADPNARFHCSFGSDAMGRSQLQIDDAQTGQRTTVDNVDDNGGCPSETDPTIKVWRRDSSDNLTLWSGRYDDLQMVPIDLTVTRLIQDFSATDVSVVMIASPPGQPDADGLYEIDMATFAVTGWSRPCSRAARGPKARRLLAPSTPAASSPTRHSTAGVWRASPTISVTGARWARTVARRCSSDRSRPDRRERWRCSTTTARPTSWLSSRPPMESTRRRRQSPRCGGTGPARIRASSSSGTMVSKGCSPARRTSRTGRPDRLSPDGSKLARVHRADAHHAHRGLLAGRDRCCWST